MLPWHHLCINRVLDLDFRKAKFITNEDEVSQANDRIEFLLDTAEMRLREAALCGWDHRGQKLNHCIAMITNGFFIEMVGTLGAFFDSAVFVDEMKGFGSKLELIRTYVYHCDWGGRWIRWLFSGCDV